MPQSESPGEGRLVDIGGTRLFVVEKSLEGFPLICLHGGPGLDHWLFADYLDPLVPDLRLILVDLRGHGMSDEAAELSLDLLAEDVGALATELGLAEYALLGHSYGARVALRHALDRPPGLSRLVLVAPRTRRAPVSGEDDVRESIRASFVDAELANGYLRRIAPFVERPEAARALDADTEDLAPRLGDLTVPTLVIYGAHDEPEVRREAASAIPAAELVELERSGHYPFVEEQDAFLDAVRRFVRASA